MARVFIFLTLASVLLAAAALISVLSVEDKTRIRSLPRSLWVIVIIFVPLLGSVGYFVAGRPQKPGGNGPGWGLGGRPAAPPPSPDDDPDFLRSLDQPGPPDEDEMLRRWENEMWEDDRHRRDPGPEK